MGVSLQIEWGRIYLKEMKLFYVAEITEAPLKPWLITELLNLFLIDSC